MQLPRCPVRLGDVLRNPRYFLCLGVSPYLALKSQERVVNGDFCQGQLSVLSHNPCNLLLGAGRLTCAKKFMHAQAEQGNR
jgi:hypothetical protein